MFSKRVNGKSQFKVLWSQINLELCPQSADLASEFAWIDNEARHDILHAQAEHLLQPNTRKQ